MQNTIETKTKEVKARTRCEVYSRSVGYIRPTQQWHVGKKHEFALRKTYSILSKLDCCAII